MWKYGKALLIHTHTHTHPSCKALLYNTNPKHLAGGSKRGSRNKLEAGISWSGSSLFSILQKWGVVSCRGADYQMAASSICYADDVKPSLRRPRELLSRKESGRFTSRWNELCLCIIIMCGCRHAHWWWGMLCAAQVTLLQELHTWLFEIRSVAGTQGSQIRLFGWPGSPWVWLTLLPQC